MQPKDYSRPGWLLFLSIVALSAIHLYCPPNRAAELSVVPDSVEYAVAGHEFAETGKYQIQVNGRALPPRYPPGFSVLVLAPIYKIAPANIGNGILAVWACGVLAAMLVYLIANRLAGPWAGFIAVVLLLHHANFTTYTQLIMTDVPSAALGLLACAIFLRIRRQPTPKPANYLLAGVVVAISISIRPLTGLLVLPFLFDIARRRGSSMWGRLVALGIPCAIAVAANSIYQQHAFGDWRRTGYQFWLPVPYDYPSLTFSPRYFHDNFELLTQHPQLALPMLLGIIGLIALWKKRAAGVGGVLLFAGLAAVPLSGMHMFYFFRDVRFHFLLISLAFILAGAGIASLIPANFRQRLGPILPILALLILFPPIHALPSSDAKPVRHQVAEAARNVLPNDAILISRVDPAYLEHLVSRGTSRTIIPLDRETPYASALLAHHRIPVLAPAPKNAGDHACIGLLNGGADQLYPHTADEMIETIRQWMAEGRPVYLEELSTDAAEPARVKFANAFDREPTKNVPWIVKLKPK